MEINNVMKLHDAIDYSLLMIEGMFAGAKGILTPYLSGDPGCGKSEMLALKVPMMGWNYLTFTIGLIRVERFTGIPKFQYCLYQGEKVLATVWSIPEIVATIRKAAEEKPVVVLFDDFHTAAPEIQAIGFELFTYWSINGYDLPRDRVAFVLAGNPSAAAGSRNSFSAVMNRVQKIHCEASFEYWRDEYAYKTGVLNEIISFLDNASYRPYFHGEEDTKEPWPSPRSWVGLSQALTRCKGSGIDFSNEDNNGLLQQIVSAHVGKAAATEYLLYHTIYSKVNAKKIFASGKFKLPTDPIQRFAFGAACTAEFFDLESKTPGGKSHMKTFSEIINGMEKVCPEIVVRAIRFLQGKDMRLLSTLVKENIISNETLQSMMKNTKILAANQ